MTRDADRYRRLEVRSRRGLGADGVLHPDRCCKLTLHGVDFAIPPPAPMVTAVFADGACRSVRTSARDDLPVRQLADLLPEPRQEACPTCGQPAGGSLALDAEADAAVVRAVFNLAAKALLCQYDLTDEQLGELLSWTGDAAPWVGQLVAWACGLR